MTSGDEGGRLDPAPVAELLPRESTPAVASDLATPEPPARPDVPSSAPTEAPAAAPRASFVARFAAALLDLLVLVTMDAAIVWTTSTAVLAAERLVGHPFNDAADVVGALVGAGSVALAVSYFVFLHARSGQTLGKSALRIRVVRVSGAPVGFARSTVRCFGYLLSALPLGLGFLCALASSRRALHDYLAGTVVERV